MITERDFVSFAHRVVSKASMRPRSDDHGKEVCEGKNDRSEVCFNEAAIR